MRYPTQRAPAGAALRHSPRIGPSLRRQRFVAAFIEHANATAAAAAAGYSARTAHAAGHRLLRRGDVQALIAEAQRVAAVTPERVVRELALLAFSNMRDFVHPDGRVKSVHELTRDQAAAIRKVEATTTRCTDAAGIETVERSARLELSDKRAALQLLGQHTGIFADGQAGAQTSFTLIIAEPRPPELRRGGRRPSGAADDQ